MALVPLSDLAPRLLAYTNSSVGKTAFLRKPLLRVDVQPLLRLLRKPTKLKLVDFLNPPAMASRSFGKRKPRDGGAGKSFRTAKQLDALLCAFAHICTEIQEHTMSSTKKSDPTDVENRKGRRAKTRFSDPEQTLVSKSDAKAKWT